jgi:hypothetical protein
MGQFFVDNIKPDFGWHSPKRTKKECANPDFADHKLHRVAIMKDEHWGAKGIVRIIKLYGALLIPLKIYKWLKSDLQKQL